MSPISRELLQKGEGAYYIRVSTDHQDTERQKSSIDAWTRKQGVTIAKQFQFLDEGFVRDMPQLRPEFQRLLAAAESGLIQWIVADSQDRFGTKDKYQFISFMYRLREANCMFITVDGKCWTDNSMVAFLEGGLGAETSEKEQKDKGWRVINALIGKAHRGDWLGGHVAFGMDIGCFDSKDREKWRVVIEGREQVGTKPGKKGKPRRVYATRRLKVFPNGDTQRFDGVSNFPAKEKNDTLRQVPTLDQDKLSVVQTIFEKYATEQISPTQIAKFLNSVGIGHHYSDRWEHHHVREILKNPIYVGLQRWNSNGQGRFFELLANDVTPVQTARGRRERDKTDWVLSDKQLFDPVISVNVWEEAQRRIAIEPKASRSPKSSELWLSGLLICAHCGKPMRGMKRPNRLEYFCSSYAKLGESGPCRRHAVNQSVVEDEIRRYLRQASIETAAILESRETKDIRLLQPFTKRHMENFARFRNVLENIWNEMQEMPCTAEECAAFLIKDREPTDWQTVLNSENNADLLQGVFGAIADLHQWICGSNDARLKSEISKLDRKHTEAMRCLESLNPATAKRAIDKANQNIAEIERRIEELEVRLSNLAEEFDETLDQLRSSERHFCTAAQAITDTGANNRRKALAVRSCIKQINLSFSPTGKRYPTSTLEAAEIIPVGAEYPIGASHSPGTALRGRRIRGQPALPPA